MRIIYLLVEALLAGAALKATTTLFHLRISALPIPMGEYAHP